MGLLSSLFIIFFIAFLELNIYSFIYKNSPQKLGVIANTSQISDTLLKNRAVPKILISEKESKSAIIKMSQQAVGTDNYYGGIILPNFPKFLIFSKISSQPNVILIDDTLIISQLDPNDFQILSPVLGYLLTQKYFTQLSIKSFPKVEIISDDQYRQFRRDDFFDKLKLVDLYQQQTEASIASYSSQLKDLDTSINSIKFQIKNIYLAIDKKSLSLRKPLYDQVSLLNSQLDEANKSKSETDIKLTDTQKLSQYFTYQKSLGAKLIDNIPSERGSFFPPDIIKMTLDTNNPHTIADNLQLFVHEYLHYASYVGNDKKLNNPFFEEGLTEFYARKIISDKLGTNTNLGYPVLNIIFTKFAKNLPDSDLLEIYFTKNESSLIKLLDQVYGKNFYAQNQALFIAIQSTNDRQQLLPLANLLMSKIKGDQLSDEDLKSTFSNY